MSLVGSHKLSDGNYDLNIPRAFHFGRHKIPNGKALGIFLAEFGACDTKKERRKRCMEMKNIKKKGGRCERFVIPIEITPPWKLFENFEIGNICKIYCLHENGLKDN